MKKITTLATAALTAGLLAGCASAHQGSAPATHSAKPAATSAPAAAPATSAAPDPSGTASGSCDYTLANSIYGNDYLTGEVDLTNTGNVGTVVRVVVKWPQEGYAPIRATKTVRTAAGSSDVPVRFHVSAGSTDSGSNVIENLQSWVDGHNNPSNICTYKTTILSTYGPTS